MWMKIRRFFQTAQPRPRQTSWPVGAAWRNVVEARACRPERLAELYRAVGQSLEKALQDADALAARTPFRGDTNQRRQPPRRTRACTRRRQAAQREGKSRATHRDRPVGRAPCGIGGKAVAVAGIRSRASRAGDADRRGKFLAPPKQIGFLAVILAGHPGWNGLNQQALLSQGVRAVGFCGEQIEFIAVDRLLCVIRDQEGRAAKLSKQPIAHGRKERPEVFIHLLAGLDLEHDQRRVAGKEIAAAGDDVLLLAFRIELHEVRRRPASCRVFAIQAGDARRFTRAAVAERVEFARAAEHQPALALAIGQRERRYVEVGRCVQVPASRQQRACLAAGFIGEHLARRTDQTRHRQAVDSVIGADVDDGHPRPQPVAKKIHLFFEPAFLLEKDIGGDGVETCRNRQRHGVSELELKRVHCNRL